MLWLAIGIGTVFVVEGLVLALAPSRIEDMLKLIAQVPIEKRRLIGLSAIAVGVAVLWVSRAIS